MKWIIYAGIGLFSVATVYGVADYYSAKKKGTLDKLYKEPEEVVVTETPPVITDIGPSNITETNKMNTASVSKVVKKSKRPKRTIRLEEFSRGKIEEPPIVIERVIWADPVTEERKKEEVVPVTEVKVEAVAKPVVIKKVFRRKISLDDFSRAPLRKPVKIEIAKKD